MKRYAVYIVFVAIVFSIFAILFAFGFTFIKTENSFSNAVEQGIGGFADMGGYGDAVSSTTETSDLTSNFAKLYFNNLNSDYYGYNEYGTCGHIAIGMLLSFYDTFWNDNFVSEEHDKSSTITDLNVDVYNNSPGHTDISQPTWSDFLFYVLNKSERHLPKMLVKIGIDLGYHRDEYNEIDFTQTMFYQLHNIFIRYFELNPSISQYKLSVKCENHEFDYMNTVPNTNYTYSTKLRREVVSYVKKGIPVMVGLSGSTSESEGHVVIAYDYDETTDTIYGHFGWFDKPTSYNHKDIESMSYNNISAYIAIDKDTIQHVHSNNLLLNGEGICSCALSNHIHEIMSYSIILNNENMHRAICYCGQTSTKAHNFRVVGRNYVCSQCGFSKAYDGGFYPIIITPNNIIEDLNAIGIDIGGEGK